MCASINCSSSKITAVVAISPPRDLIHTVMFRTMMSTQAFSPHKWTHKSQRRPVNGAIRLILIHFRRTYFLQIRPEMAICVQIHWKKGYVQMSSDSTLGAGWAVGKRHVNTVKASNVCFTLFIFDGMRFASVSSIWVLPPCSEQTATIGLKSNALINLNPGTEGLTAPFIP